MKIEEKGNTAIIRNPEGDSKALLAWLENEQGKLEGKNLILDLTSDAKLRAKDLSVFSALAKARKKSRTSFVIVHPSLDFTAVPASINAVPTIREAHDLIEMDEIERDLGF